MTKKLLALVFIIAVVATAFLVWQKETVQAAWFNSDWTKRVKITIQSSQVGSDLTDFPVYIDLSTLPADFHTNVNQTDARDIRVTKSDGTTEVPREVVFYTAASDTGELHFKASGTLSSSVDTDFYIYYGNASASEPAADATYGSENVWTGYLAVYHMQEASGNLLDSTTNDRHMTVVGSPTYGATGKIGRGVDFSGTGQYAEIATAIATAHPFSITLWGEPDNTDAFKIAASVGKSSDDTTYAYTLYGNTPVVTTLIRVADVNASAISTTNYSADVFSHTASVFTSNTSRTVYLNAGGSSTNTDSKTPSGWDLTTIASAARSTKSALFDGVIDEVRFASTALSADWISSEYTNQNTPTTFYTVGAADDKVDDWPYRIKITVDADNISADLTDFSLILDLANLPIHFHTNVKSDGGDIRVTKADGTTEVPRDVITYDATTDTGQMRFKASGTLSSTTDTDFYIYYGNASASEPAADATYGQYNAYDSSWEGYWPDGGGTDRTVNDNDGTANGGVTIGGATGKIGAGTEFDGTDDYVALAAVDAATFEFANNYSIVFWADTGTIDQYDVAISTVDQPGNGWRIWTRDATSFKWYNEANSVRSISTSNISSDFQHVSNIMDSSNDLYIYVDGAEEDGPDDAGGNVSYGAYSTRTVIGAMPENAAATTFRRFYQGILNQVSIHSTARSADWIAAEYAQTNDNAGFWGIGTEAVTDPVQVDSRIERGSNIKIQGGSMRINNR